MENQQDSTTSQPITLTLEVVPEDPQNSDPALVDAVGRDTADALRSEGYTVQPVYTGIRGGPLVETIAFLSQTLAAAWANKEALISDVSGLVTILTTAATVVEKARQAYEKRVGKDTALQYPISFSLDINGMPVPLPLLMLKVLKISYKWRSVFKQATLPLGVQIHPEVRRESKPVYQNSHNGRDAREQVIACMEEVLQACPTPPMLQM